MCPDGHLRSADGRFALCAAAASCRFGRKCCDLASDRMIREAQIIGGLKIEPELRAGLEPVSETERGIAGNRTLALNDLRGAALRHGNMTLQFGRRGLDVCQFGG